MPDLLLELGCEELPASSIKPAFRQLESEIRRRLEESHLAFGESLSLGTPRRLIVGIRDVADRQPDQTIEARGPSAKAAFKPDGEPTPALLGFCRGQMVDPSDVRVEGDYVWVRRVEPGKSASELLADILPASIQALEFKKTMRWGAGRLRFARPIRWIVSLFADEIVPFELAGVASGRMSRGHRFLAPQEFPVASLNDLLEQLRSHNVEADPEKREQMIRRQAIEEQPSVVLADDLVEENVNLCEWPMPTKGEFPSEFLSLPEQVLVTVMAKHERFFPVRDQQGHLTNQFVSVRNGGEASAVSAGNTWVLVARFKDASHFFEEDSRFSMDDFLERLQATTFQEKLGNLRQRADRLAALAEAVGSHFGLPDSALGHLRTAGLYAKADLSTGLVAELDELQGIVGGIYAQREGMPLEVCQAISGHYNPSDLMSFLVAVSDHLDRLVGYVGVNILPSGSSDPFGLRRSAGVIIDTFLRHETPIAGLLPLVKAAVGQYSSQGVQLVNDQLESDLAEVFVGRYQSVFSGYRHDTIDGACTEAYALDPQAIRCRLGALELLQNDTTFLQSASRPANIVSAAERKGLTIEAGFPQDDSLDSAEASALKRAVEQAKPLASQALERRDSPQLAAVLQQLIAPINAFFDSTMVMVDDERVRQARLSLLKSTQDVFELAGDFSKIVVDKR